MLIKKEDINNWQEFVDSKLNMMSLDNPKDKIYRAVAISDELFEELSGKAPAVKVGEEWEDVQRCPLCGEYIFIKKFKQHGMVSFDAEGNENYIANIDNQVNKLQCKCGVEIYIDNRRED